jgi:hypothetical protein
MQALSNDLRELVVEAAIKAAGARFWYLPPHSLDLSIASFVRRLQGIALLRPSHVAPDFALLCRADNDQDIAAHRNALKVNLSCRRLGSETVGKTAYASRQ